MGHRSEEFRLIVTTAGSTEQAESLASALVERRLAACVNILGDVCSVFRWKGKVEKEGERVLLIKSTSRLFPEVCKAIRELHSNDLPEVIALPILDGDPGYLDWLAQSLTQD